jgi:hypothetical protein
MEFESLTYLISLENIWVGWLGIAVFKVKLSTYFVHHIFSVVHLGFVKTRSDNIISSKFIKDFRNCSLVLNRKLLLAV